MAIIELEGDESEEDFSVEILDDFGDVFDGDELGIMTRGEGGGAPTSTYDPAEVAATQAATKLAFDEAQKKVDAQTAAREAQQQEAVQLAVEQARATGGDVVQAEQDALTRSALEAQDVTNSGGDLTKIVVPSAQTPVQQLPAQQMNPWDQFWHNVAWGIDKAIKDGQTAFDSIFGKKK